MLCCLECLKALVISEDELMLGKQNPNRIIEVLDRFVVFGLTHPGVTTAMDVIGHLAHLIGSLD